MKGFALLWSKILDSSVWMESKEARLVWITMLAMKDSEGKVFAAAAALAHRARVETEECQKALEIFLAPDPSSTSPNDEGRRLRVIPGGWQIINHEQYRFSTEAKRQFWRESKRQEREARAAAGVGPGKGKAKKKVGRPVKSAMEMAMERAQADGDEEGMRRLGEMADGVEPGGGAMNGSE